MTKKPTKKKPAKLRLSPITKLIWEHEAARGKLQKEARNMFEGVTNLFLSFGLPEFRLSLARFRETTKNGRFTFDSLMPAMRAASHEALLLFASMDGKLLRVNVETALNHQRPLQLWLTDQGVDVWTTLVRIRHRDHLRGLATISPQLTSQLVGLAYSERKAFNVDYLADNTPPYHDIETLEEKNEPPHHAGLPPQAPVPLEARPEIGLGRPCDAHRDSAVARPADLPPESPRLETGGPIRPPV